MSIGLLEEFGTDDKSTTITKPKINLMEKILEPFKVETRVRQEDERIKIGRKKMKLFSFCRKYSETSKKHGRLKKINAEREQKR